MARTSKKSSKGQEIQILFVHSKEGKIKVKLVGNQVAITGSDFASGWALVQLGGGVKLFVHVDLDTTTQPSVSFSCGTRKQLAGHLAEVDRWEKEVIEGSDFSSEERKMFLAQVRR